MFAAAGCVRKETLPYTPDPFIADPVFMAYCQADFDFNGDGYFSKVEAAKVTGIDLGNAGVESLEGIHCFTALRSLDVAANSIEEMNISANTKLTLLECADNLLMVLDISRNTSLMSLSCRGNADDLVIYVRPGFDSDALSYCSVPDNAVFEVK